MVETKTTNLSPLHETISTTATDFWNDSCSIAELTYAIDRRRHAKRPRGLAGRFSSEGLS